MRGNLCKSQNIWESRASKLCRKACFSKLLRQHLNRWKEAFSQSYKRLSLQCWICLIWENKHIPQSTQGQYSQESHIVSQFIWKILCASQQIQSLRYIPLLSFSTCCTQLGYFQAWGLCEWFIFRQGTQQKVKAK